MPTQLERLRNTSWKIPATKQGKRTVARVSPTRALLLSDPDEKMCKAFDVMKMKSMYGKQYIGVDRSTFLINDKGMVVKEWRSVKVKGHVDEVLSAAEEL